MNFPPIVQVNTQIPSALDRYYARQQQRQQMAVSQHQMDVGDQQLALDKQTVDQRGQALKQKADETLAATEKQKHQDQALDIYSVLSNVDPNNPESLSAVDEVVRSHGGDDQEVAKMRGMLDHPQMVKMVKDQAGYTAFGEKYAEMNKPGKLSAPQAALDASGKPAFMQTDEQGNASAVTGFTPMPKADKSGDYTLHPGEQRRNFRNEVVATGADKPADKLSSLEEKLALAHKTWPEMGDSAVADMVLGNSKSVVGADGRVYTRNDRTNDVTVTNPSSGEAAQTPDGGTSEYLPEITGPNNKLSLYKLAEKVSGPESSVVTAVSPVLQNIGVDSVETGREYARTVYEAAQGSFVQSMMQSSGMRYGGLGMMKEIKKQIDIAPKFWDNWELLQQRLVGVSDFLKTRIAQDQTIIDDPTSPRVAVTNAKSNQNAAKHFLEIADVPDGAKMGQNAPTSSLSPEAAAALKKLGITP